MTVLDDVDRMKQRLRDLMRWADEIEKRIDRLLAESEAEEQGDKPCGERA